MCFACKDVTLWIIQYMIMWYFICKILLSLEIRQTVLDAVHSTQREARFASVQASRGLCVVMEEGRWRKSGETDEAERWQALSHMKKALEVTGPTLNRKHQLPQEFLTKDVRQLFRSRECFSETGSAQTDWLKLHCCVCVVGKLWISGGFRVKQEDN